MVVVQGDILPPGPEVNQWQALITSLMVLAMLIEAVR